MKLRDYLHIHRLTAREFSIIINYQRGYIVDVKNEKKRPGKKFIAAVERATNGEVSEDDFKQLNRSKTQKKKTQA